MVIESDGDLSTALASFIEVAGSNLPPKFRTIHISECTEVMLQQDDRCEPLEPKVQPVSLSKKEEVLHQYHLLKGQVCKYR